MNILEHITEFKRKIIAGSDDYETAKVYGNCMNLFLKHYELKHSSPLHCSLLDMENYIIHLREKNYSPSYINQFIASAKRFYRINGQPKKCDGLIYHRKQQKTPNILTRNECVKMCESDIYIKHRAIINLLYYGALRRREVKFLKLEDISFEDNKLTIIDSKFGKSRVIPIPDFVTAILNKYISKCNPKVYLFNGEKDKLQYSFKSIENIIKNTAKLCGIEKNVHPHIMRSSFATHLLDFGASDMYVSEFLGHEKIQTTKDYYCRLTIKGMQDNFNNAYQRMR